MRPAAIVGVLALAGCNQIFGLDKTSVRDGATVDAPTATAHIRWLVATTDKDLIPEPPQLMPIVPAPLVFVGPLGRVAMPVAINTDGAIAYTPGPDPWRLVYTLAGGVPREVQWNPPADRGNLIVPLFGRHDRIAPPSASGYQLAPSNPPTNGTPMRVFTVGMWTRGPNYLYGGPNDILFAGTTPLSGSLGALEKAKGDAIVLQGIGNVSGCSLVVGAAHGQADLAADTISSVTPFEWHSSRDVAIQVSHPQLADLEQGLQSALAKRQGTIVQPSRFEYGVLPSLGMPGFTQQPESGGAFLMPTPLMVPFANCDLQVATTPSFVEPDELLGMPRGVHAQIVSVRTPANGPTLVSGIQELVGSTTPFTLSFNVRLAIAPIVLGAHDLADAPDDDPITITEPTKLSFALSTPAGVADYFDIALFRLDGMSLVPIVVYTVTEPEVVIDPTVFSPGLRYVFSIRSYSGYPDADTGDFSKIVLPLAAGTIYTRTFIAE